MTYKAPSLSSHFEALHRDLPEVEKLLQRGRAGDLRSLYYGEELMDAHMRDGDRVGYWVGCARARWESHS